MKKPPSQRRAALPREVGYTKAFLKDWERYYRAGKYDLNHAKEVMMLLIENSAPCRRNGLNIGSVVSGRGFRSAISVAIFF